MPFQEGRSPGRTEGAQGASSSQITHELRRRELMRLLLEGRSAKQAAVIMGVGYQTLINYSREERFRDELRQLHSDRLDQMDTEYLEARKSKVERIDELQWIALDKLEELLVDEHTHASIRAKLIDSVLDRGDQSVSRSRKLDITERKVIFKGEDLLHAVTAMQEIQAHKQLKEAEESAKDETPSE